MVEVSRERGGDGGEPALISHLEHYLGAMEGGFQLDEPGSPTPFQVARFPYESDSRTCAFATLGLARFALPSRTSEKEIHHELLMLVPEALAVGPIPGILQQVGLGALSAHGALLRGDVLGPVGPVIDGSSMEALYVSAPAYLPDEFAACDTEGHRVVIAWLVPISRREADFIVRHGWEAVEEALVSADPDLVDVFRDSMPL
jgi:hypothetical protein